MAATWQIFVALCCVLRCFSCDAAEPKKGLNIDVSFGGDVPLGQITGDDSSGALLEVTRPVPYIEIRPNELESVNRLAEIALETEAISPVVHKEYYQVLEQLEELSPEEMLSELIAQTNTLEALKAELGAEESVAA
ncbi:hypothetical protein, conserved [Babesia bigemina]|uniref:Uncharacterized protein n=1 Tax=Babesia bigemina TaxID=5866 RepID=A0A061DB37_BABBI|nr:hypothetical protein, conserved [Babesia bigemina]CDR97753.1 hypothetical protein, conserved [Babesia bigemina]|eukprot:XP_012769939.1 hypothetical protein, conserved [Babesia bigemina]